MSDTQSFWPVAQREGEPPFWVCMSCLSEVFYRKVPMPNCPGCHGVSTYEAFAIEAIADWGTEDLVAKAKASEQAAERGADSRIFRRVRVISLPAAERLLAGTTPISYRRPMAPGGDSRSRARPLQWERPGRSLPGERGRCRGGDAIDGRRCQGDGRPSLHARYQLLQHIAGCSTIGARNSPR